MDATKKADIIRKLNAMKALANDPATPETMRENILAKVAKMMAEYNVTLTEMDIKAEGVGKSNFKTTNEPGKHVHEIYWVVVAISKLTETKVVYLKRSNSYDFIGTQTDIDYAEFLFRLCYQAIEQSWVAYKHSYEYAKLCRDQHGKAIRSTYRKSFAYTLSNRIMALIEEKPKVPGNSLVVCKNSLIQAFCDNEYNKLKQDSKKVITLRDWSNDVMGTAYNEAKKVNLRKEFNRADKPILKLNYGD